MIWNTQFMWRFQGWFNVSKENETTFGWFALNHVDFLILVFDWFIMDVWEFLEIYTLRHVLGECRSFRAWYGTWLCRVVQEGAQETLYANYIRTLITYCAKTLMRTQASARGSINVKSKSDFGQPSYEYIKILCICISGVYIYRYNGMILYMFVCFIWWCIYIGDEWNPSTSIFWISISPLQPFTEILLNQASFHEIWSRVDED